MGSRAEGKKGSERTTSSETAARTRPLSIQEILLRREKKAAAEAKKTAATKAKKTKEELQDNEKGKQNHPESGRGHKSRKDLKDVPVEGSRKERTRDAPREESKKDDVRHMSKEESRKDNTRHAPREVSKKEHLKDRPKDGSKLDNLKDSPKVPRKDDQRDAPKKGSKKGDDGQSAGKEKDAHGSHKLSTSTKGRPAESTDGNHGEIRARNGDAARSESLKGPLKRWNGEPVHNDRIKERSDRLWSETKRKNRGFDDQRRPDVDLPMLKKYDSARFQVSKHDDRIDGRREYGKPYYEEPRAKRRRSRSRDYDQGRRDRSFSPPPREQRHSYRGHDHDNYPPGRKYAENDRHRTSGNGGHGGGSYQRHESPLGGYSPRKRKTIPQDEHMTTKIAPVIGSPEKKPATWDQPPAGADQSNFFTTLQPIVSQTSSVTVSSSVPKLNTATTLETILSGNSSSDSVQLTQATRPLRRLHIENLTSSASEDMLIGCLNDFLLSSGVSHIQRSKQPCLSCTINKEKCQAFVEFLTPEDATAALSFDGRSFNGSALKIRRPKEYIEIPHVAPKKPVEEEIKVTSDVADSPHKIFVAGISAVLSSEMLVEIVSSFGHLAAYHFVFNEDLGGRCAFLEYIDHSITNKACAGLNGMKLGGCILTAVLVFPNPLEVCNESSPFYGIPNNAKTLLEEPTNVLQLKNVVDREEYLLLSKPDLEEILEDVRLECARFGAVKSINIVEYPASSDSIAEDIIVEPKDGPVKLESTECCANDNCAETEIDCSLPGKSIAVPSDPMEIADLGPISEGKDHKELDTLCEGDAPATADQCTDLDDIHAMAASPSLVQQTEAGHVDSMQANQDATAVGDILARAAGPTLDQQTEADHMDSTQADQEATPVGDIHATAVDPTLDQQMEASHVDSAQADQETTAVGDVHATAADPTLDHQTEADHVDSTQADQDATAVSDDSAAGEGHAGSVSLDTCTSTTPGDAVQKSETENKQQSINDVSETGSEELPASDTRGDALVSECVVLEAGSILIEFMRKEAACVAAHSLHGRSFGDRTVSAGYAPHDLYLRRYRRLSLL